MKSPTHPERRAIYWAIVTLALASFTAGMILARRESSRENPRESARERELRKQIEHTCATGLGALHVVRIKLQRDDADAVDVAKDFFTYGQPWLALCGRAPEVSEFLTADRARLIELIAGVERKLTEQP